MLKSIDKFIQFVNAEILKGNNDCGYVDYCLGERDMLMKMKTVVSGNQDIGIAIGKIKELQDMAKKKIDTDSRNFYVGSVNVVDYVLRDFKNSVDLADFRTMFNGMYDDEFIDFINETFDFDFKDIEEYNEKSGIIETSDI